MKAAEEMKREEKPNETPRKEKMQEALAHYDEIATKACWHRSDIPEAIRAYYAPLPPAGGATDKFRDVLNEVQRYIETNGGATESEIKAIWNSLSCAITESEKRQPTAEGAEEILAKYLIRDPISKRSALEAMHEFATLHAQKIADKMVEERLREDDTKKLLETIISWEKDLSEYMSLETKLRELFIIKSKQL